MTLIWSEAQEFSEMCSTVLPPYTEMLRNMKRKARQLTLDASFVNKPEASQEDGPGHSLAHLPWSSCSLSSPTILRKEKVGSRTEAAVVYVQHGMLQNN